MWNKKAEQEYQDTRKHKKGNRRKNLAEDFDIRVVWAEALKLYREGYNAEYSTEELRDIRKYQELATRRSTKLEAFYHHFTPTIKNDPQGLFLASQEICDYLNKSQHEHRFSSVVLGRELKKDGIKKFSGQAGKKGYWLVTKWG